MADDETRDDEPDEATDNGEPGDSDSSDSSASGGANDADAPGLVRVIKRIDNGIGTGELGLLTITLVVLVLVGSYAAIMGIFGKPTGHWTKEMVKYSVFFIAMAGAALAAQRQQMIAMDIVGRFAPIKLRAWIRVVTNLFASGIAAALMYRAIDVAKVEMKSNVPYEVISPGIGAWILPVGAGLISLHLFLHVLIDLTYLATGHVAPESDEIKVH